MTQGKTVLSIPSTFGIVSAVNCDGGLPDGNVVRVVKQGKDLKRGNDEGGIDPELNRRRNIFDAVVRAARGDDEVFTWKEVKGGSAAIVGGGTAIDGVAKRSRLSADDGMEVAVAVGNIPGQTAELTASNSTVADDEEDGEIVE
ncbi:UNVERIFIED_CONTAM: hypothetical protein HDU68_001166 [Siphonaria sp. JEL0065]|nr:hypothetical protein HDU68_001166 [Siphonaria sp. JEL0065]